MNQWIFRAALLLLWLPFVTARAGQPCATDGHTVRFMSYNIRNGVGMDEKADYDRTAEAILRQNPDVVAVQEVDSMTGRSGRRDVIRELAVRTGLFPLFAPAIDYDGGKYGIGMLSRKKPLGSRYLALPGREEARALLIVEFDDYIFCCTHLSLTPEDGVASWPLILEAARAAGKPFFIAGDWNATPDSELLEAVQKDFRIISRIGSATYPADKPEECIDYIAGYVGKGQPFTVLSAAVVDEPAASDHRPLVADVRLHAPADRIFRAKPYLQNPAGGGITVMWQTSVPAYSWVEYGTDTLHLAKARMLRDGQVICNNHQAKIRLDDLQPGRTYYYRVCSREITLYEGYRKAFGETAISPFYTFALPDAQSSDFTALVFNDLHKHTATLDALYERVKDVPYDFVVFNGDCIDDPADAEEALYHLAYMCQKVGAERVPAFFLRGNHEIRNAYSIGLRELFDYVGDKTYGAFNWGDTRFVMLDCGEDKPDSTWVYYGLNDFTGLRNDQTGFLKAELHGEAFRKASRRVLLNHIPVYGNGDEYQPCTELWGPLLAKAPFDVNLSAHTHQYAFHPRGTVGNPFPVAIGGGYKPESATVMVLRKKGKELSLQVLNTKGETLLEKRF